jgi:hypothetical protein
MTPCARDLKGCAVRLAVAHGRGDYLGYSGSRVVQNIHGRVGYTGLGIVTCKIVYYICLEYVLDIGRSTYAHCCTNALLI